jgi:predicted amidohydrolase
MKKFHLACIQTNSGEDLKSNFAQAETWIREAGDRLAKIILLPENFAFMGRENRKLEMAEEIETRAREFLAKMGKETGSYILGGGYPTRSPEGSRFYNTASLYGPRGDLVLEYNKIHLFDSEPGDGVSYQESRTVRPGESLPNTVLLPGLCTLGTTICYDLRFPEIFRGLVDKGAELIGVPAAFTKITGEAHWEILLRARAIENACFIFAAGQTGFHGKSKETYGNSMIIDPWGRVLSRSGTETGYCLAEIDLSVLREMRAKLPNLTHRRKDLYTID